VKPHRPNRLAREKSPYLLQHARNPVDWYPWGAEAFAKAKREKKIVFLSIGYSTCHWCHVMERESFEDPEAAEVLNSLTVPVKVDREERPDLDQVYMAVCQALTGSGGWPLTVLLTPDALPFFAGTYFPKESRYGRIGLLELVRRAAEIWEREPGELESSGRNFIEQLRGATAPASGGELDRGVLEAAAESLLASQDEERGGFGSAPKFPTPHHLSFLLRRRRRTGNPSLLHAVNRALSAMARGGIFDHVGYGFHRYSTDRDWLLPHFEKMLYDQAGLAAAYLEGYQATGNGAWAEVARRVFEYVARDLTAPEGAFYSAEDADSEGEEGKFYVWTREEIFDVLGREEGELWCRVYGVQEAGNYADEATGRLTGANVLHLAEPPPEGADRTLGLTGRLEDARRKLFERRSRRVRPSLDDKVITAWNGMMISALAKGGRVLGDPEYSRRAERAAEFLWRELRPKGRLLRRYRQGEAAIEAFAEDYALLARGYVDLYEAGYRPEYLLRALELGRELVERFWDAEGQGLFDTASDAEALVLRPKQVYDGATPSANSVALELFARLWLLTGDPAWAERARRILHAFAESVNRFPAGHTHFLQAAALLFEPAREVVIAGERGSEGTEALLSALARTYAPETQSLLVDPALFDACPFVAQLGLAGEKAAAYVCEGFTCRAPLEDAAALREVLARPPLG
jgi:uncharacterized protein